MHDEVTRTLLDELHRRLAAPDMSHRKLEVALGLPTNELKGILDASHPRTPSVEKAKKIAEALGFEFYVGPPRASAPPAPIRPGEFVNLPVYDVQLAAGAGALNDNEMVIDHLSFRADWLKRMGISIRGARIGRALGPSMEPTIWDKDPILIDVSKRDVPVYTPARGRRGPIFALLHSGEARVKRVLRYASGATILSSDNEDFPPEPVRLEDLSIIGKVMWWAHANRE